MSAPYDNKSFTATSGNECRLRIHPVQRNGEQEVSLAWDRDATAADMQEVDQWFQETQVPIYAARANAELQPPALEPEDALIRERVTDFIKEAN